jgi:hypothetical protein
MTCKSLSLVTGVGLFTLLYGASPAWAQAIAPTLGSTSTYGVVSSTFTNSNISPQTIINGTSSQPAVCYTTLSGSPPLTVVGSTVVPCPPQTGLDQGTALATLNGQACTSLGTNVALNSVTVGANPPGTFPPGCYSSSGAMSVVAGTTVTLSGAGVYVFRSGGAITTGASSSVIVGGGACESDVYWAPIGAATLGATAPFAGSILDAAGITIGQATTLTGRALAFGGTVTTANDTITVPTCTSFSGGVPPTITKAFSPSSNGAGGISTLTITLNNLNATAATLTAALVDTLPAGVVIAASPNASTTCGGLVTAPAGGGSVTLSAGSAIPGGAPGRCTVIANVTSATPATYTNTIVANALQTSKGSNAVAATATLIISAAIPPVPTLPEWAMIMLVALLCLSGFLALGQRRSTD